MISYEKLRMLLAKHTLRMTNVCKDAGISASLVTRFNHDKPVNIDSIDKMCIWLSANLGKKINVGDIMDIKLDGEE